MVRRHATDGLRMATLSTPCTLDSGFISAAYKHLAARQAMIPETCGRDCLTKAATDTGALLTGSHPSQDERVPSNAVPAA